MSCLLPFPASHICHPPGLLVHLSPEPLQVLKVSDGTSTPAPTPTPHRKSLQGCRVFSPSHWALSVALDPHDANGQAPEYGHLPTDVSHYFLAVVAQLPLRSRCRDRVNNLQLAGGQSWGDGGAREGKGALSCLFFPLGQGPFESKATEMCRTVTSETRKWRVSVRMRRRA